MMITQIPGVYQIAPLLYFPAVVAASLCCHTDTGLANTDVTMLLRLIALCGLFITSIVHSGTILFVATDGDDINGDGSSGNPWATITHAVDNASDSATIIVRPGTYNGRARLRQEFDSQVTIRSEIPYAAKLRYDQGAVVISFTGRNITMEGFDIAHAPGNTGGLVIQVQDLLGKFNGSNNGTDPVVSGIVFRNNIIHDSTNNDLLKINNGAEDVLVEGNMFFNQFGSDEHMDVNSVIGVTIQDNVFFNTVDNDTSSFIVVKDSGTGDTVVGSREVTIRRNVFLNWFGSSGQSFVRFGEDGTLNFEAQDLLVENNLMIGNGTDLMRTPLTVQGSKNLVFRNNTLTGDMPSRSFAGRLIAVGDNPPSENLEFFNNIYSDPNGTMGSEAFNGVDLFDSPAGQTANATLDNNLYWNGGNAIPEDAGQFLRFSDDANAMTGDPELGAQGGLVVPSWDGSNFADGSSSIHQAFVRLVNLYGQPDSTSPAIDNAEPANAASEDILGRQRGPDPDLGAFELDPLDTTFLADGFE